MSDPNFRVATRDEVALMLDWAAAEGWNPGLDDAAAFHAADPDGFFVATLDDAPVAAISVVKHAPRYAFLGLYLCVPEYRGRGIGFALWRHALGHAGDRTVGLDGVAAQQGNYAKSGFVSCSRTLRLEGRILPDGAPLAQATAKDFGRIADLDEAAHGVSRPDFLAEWIAPRPTRRTVMLASGDAPEGFATARLCRRGCKVGPVVAPTVEKAVLLAGQAAAAVDCADVSIDVPIEQTEFLRALGQLGFVETFATARMYKGPAPSPSPACRAIATMELG